MVGEFRSESLRRVMKLLRPEEVLKTLSEPGLCDHCLKLLEDRARETLSKRKRNGYPRGKSTSSEQSSEGFAIASTGFCIASSSIELACHKSSHPAPLSPKISNTDLALDDGISRRSSRENTGLTEEDKERTRFVEVGRKKEFELTERIKGKPVNILQGLELHTQVFNAEEQERIVEFVYELQRLGRRGKLRERTYSEPRKWMRGKGRVTIQFGCCYNYATDAKGNPPGIIRDEEVDPLPTLFKRMIKRMVRWHVLPPSCVPNSCIVNIYEEGDCIPPHIDHHDFLRPFCTVSFLTECNILFGLNLKPEGPGEFSGPFSLPLPLGSVLVLQGNGADVAKHCVPSVPAKRISITFRKMDERRMPYNFSPERDLTGIRPLKFPPMNERGDQAKHELEPLNHSTRSKAEKRRERHQTGPSNYSGYESPPRRTTEAKRWSDARFLKRKAEYFKESHDFPPLKRSSSSRRHRRVHGGIPSY